MQDAEALQAHEQQHAAQDHHIKPQGPGQDPPVAPVHLAAADGGDGGNVNDGNKGQVPEYVYRGRHGADAQQQI